MKIEDNRTSDQIGNLISGYLEGLSLALTSPTPSNDKSALVSMKRDTLDT